MNYRKIPKVELHRHLDGSIRFETITEIIKHNNLDVGVRNENELRQKCIFKTPVGSLEQLLVGFGTIQKVMCSYDAMKRIAFENVEDCVQDGIEISELRFAPTYIAEGKNIDFDEIIEGVLAGVKEACNKYKQIKVGLIHILPRSFDYKKNEQSLKTILKYRNSNFPEAQRIVGFDLAAEEFDGSHEQYLPLVEQAKSAGLGITIHSGEDTTPQMIKKSIELLKATRIGHGIRAIDDPELIELIIERDVHLEVCPTSNWLTNSITSLKDHPLPKLFKAGISLSINSDDPHLMGLDLTNEYEVCHKLFGFKEEDFIRVNQEAKRHSFI